MKNDEYGFEERDDERTWFDADGENQIVPDCEKGDDSDSDDPYDPYDHLPSDDELNAVAKEAFYVAGFLNLIDDCGKVSYFYNMKRLILDRNEKAKDVAEKYDHNVAYYEDKHTEWAKKARKSFAQLQTYAEKLGYKMPSDDGFLNSMALYEDRRKCYRYYLKQYVKKNLIFSPEELEKKYLTRLSKRKR